jgi:AraC family transcriptional regulator, regulatory protein of adaptative response / methylated-DNA-[protein]-cysteine methyltransferase
MITENQKIEYYQALLDKNTRYEGVFFVGITSTGVFCRPSCPARKPKFGNCEFFTTAEQALLASYRPCKRCRPLSHPDEASDLIHTLVKAVEENPEKRWKDTDFQNLSVDASTARRQFKKRFGMTFVAYARARRIGLAMKHIRSGNSVIDAQLDAGYESSSGFRDAFSRIMGAAPTLLGNNTVLKASWLDTHLGPMVAIADEEALYLLEFVDRRGLEREVERLRIKMKAPIIPGSTQPILSIEKELNLYFSGKLATFNTPIKRLGTPFQNSVWDALLEIPTGETRSYGDIAKAIGNPKSYRAVAQANGANQLAIIIPCHRVINSDGTIGGYGGGVPRKEWMLNHEKTIGDKQCK